MPTFATCSTTEGSFTIEFLHQIVGSLADLHIEFAASMECIVLGPVLGCDFEPCTSTDRAQGAGTVVACASSRTLMVCLRPCDLPSGTYVVGRVSSGLQTVAKLSTVSAQAGVPVTPIDVRCTSECSEPSPRPVCRPQGTSKLLSSLWE